MNLGSKTDIINVNEKLALLSDVNTLVFIQVMSKTIDVLRVIDLINRGLKFKI